METQEQLIEGKYAFTPAVSWANAVSDEQLIKALAPTDYALEQIDEGRDFCYLLEKVVKTSNKENSEYLMMAYSLTQSSNLERGSVFEQIVDENDTYFIHRIAVLRDGQLIDKIPDLKVKVLDHESQSDGGVLNNAKKINVTIKDLRLNDVLIVEDTRIRTFSDKDFMRKAYYKNVWISPDIYWVYAKYRFELINEREQILLAKKVFFREDSGTLIPASIQEIQPNTSYVFEAHNFNTQIDANRQVYPFVDFATKATWEELSAYIVPIYEEVAKEKSLSEFAPDLQSQIQAQGNLDAQIQFAIEYVQNHIRYIYNEEEMHGHKPQAAYTTYENKQGDCKAKCMLLKVILDDIGVKNTIVLVNFNTDFYQQFYNPSLLTFNHVILKIEHNGNSYFVDPTARDEYGLLEYRNFMNFKHYLPIEANQSMQVRPPHRFEKFGLEENTRVDVVAGRGTIHVKTLYRYNRANNMRRYFKNNSKKEILDGWFSFLFSALNYMNDRNEEDSRSSFAESKIEIVRDDRTLNEVEVQFTAILPNAYFTNKDGKQFLMYFDDNVCKLGVRDYNHEDVTFWHNYDGEKYEIHLYTDLSIDTNEKYTIQELSVDNPYFQYESKKNIQSNGGSMYITFNPLTNLDIPMKDIPQLKSDYRKIADSNYGLGIDIIAPSKGLLATIKSWFK